MQVSATLIAAQQAAREARAQLAMPQAAPQPGFAAALENTAGPDAGFSALPLSRVAAAQPTQPIQAAAPARLGQHVDITV